MPRWWRVGYLLRRRMRATAVTAAARPKPAHTCARKHNRSPGKDFNKEIYKCILVIIFKAFCTNNLPWCSWTENSERICFTLAALIWSNRIKTAWNTVSRPINETHSIARIRSWSKDSDAGNFVPIVIVSPFSGYTLGCFPLWPWKHCRQRRGPLVLHPENQIKYTWC